ncbi:MAG: hypothetical protein JKY42_04140 [Flavobacteriales bacterium]|nr:hypothetical protein [Flavobacteriales bacterium]
MFSPLFKANLRLSAFTFWKIPMVFFCRPKILQQDDIRTVVKIKLRRKTKNHLNSMYFGVLAVGADITGAFTAFDKAQAMGKPVSLAFKDFHADYYMRAVGDVYFTCDDGKLIDKMLAETFETGERVNKPVTVTARCPDISDDDVAKFTLTLSLKYKKKKHNSS